MPAPDVHALTRNIVLELVLVLEKGVIEYWSAGMFLSRRATRERGLEML
jgi:hypothetical protein